MSPSSEAAMKLSRFTSVVAVIYSLMAIAVAPVLAQEDDANIHHPSYRLIDLGTFGGPRSSVAGQSVVVTNNGKVAGGADTPDPDPYAPNCFDRKTCFVEHAFRWHAGVLTDLGTLPN